MCWCFESPASKFVSASLLQIVMQGFDMRVYTGSGGMSLRPVRALAFLHSKFAIVVTNVRERERASQFSGGNERVCAYACVSVSFFGTPCMGYPRSLYSPRETGGRIKKDGNVRKEKSRGSDASWSSLLPVGWPRYGP